MQAPLTPERLAATYDYLRVWPPFSSWNLPPADAIEFVTSKRLDCDAEFRPDRLRIMVSVARNHHLQTILIAVAHECIHLKQHLAGTDNRYQHNAEFKRISRSICKRYAWDYGQFVGGI